MDDLPKTQPLSAVLGSALDANSDGFVTVGEVMDRVAERGFGLLLFVVALPTLIPVLPPGASGVVGLVYIALGLQLAAGLAHPWIPKRIRNYRLSSKVVAALRTKGVSVMQRIERLSRPRWLLLEHVAVLRVLAVLIIVNGVILFLPVPFMNTLPAMGIMLIGIGLLNRDGLLLSMGGSLEVATIMIVASSAHLLLRGQAWLRGLL